MSLPFPQVRLLPIAALAAACVTAGRADAATRFVAPCGNDAWAGVNPVCSAPLGPKRTIQAAINASGLGDQVFVLAGTYLESIDLDGKAIHLVGLSGPAATTLDGNGAAHTVTCTSGETAATIIEGLRITGGSAIGSGGGLWINFSSPTVIDCEIINNEATSSGGGVSIALGSPTFQFCTIAGNTSGASGGGVHIASGNPTFEDCEIFTNECDDFGGGISSAGGNLVIEDCQIRFNDAQHGAGVAIQSGSATLTSCTLELNEAATSGGGVYIGSASATLTDLFISENYAHISGGGIAVATGGTLNITDSDIVWNVINPEIAEPAVAHGGGIRAVNATVIGSGLEIAHNEAFYGGGLSSKHSNLTLFDSQVEFNDASEDTGGVSADTDSHLSFDQVHFFGNSAPVAGGVALVDSTLDMIGGSISEHSCYAAAALSVYESSVHLDDVVIAGNQSQGFVALGVVTIVGTDAGDALFESCDFIANAALAGGAVYVSDGHASFESCGFLANVALSGGAIASDDFVGPSTVRLRNCSLQSNEATVSGGAVYVTGGVTFEAVSSSFFLNHAPFDGGAIYAAPIGFDMVNCSIYENTAEDGAGVFLVGSTVVAPGAAMTNCRVTDNDADDEGGGLLIGADMTLAITNCTISGNTASGNGSAMRVGSDAVEIANSIVWGNSGVQVSGTGEPDFRYSIIPLFQDGPACFTVDPLFVNAAAGDYRLQAGRPAIEAGNNSRLPADDLDADDDGNTTELLPTDRQGDPRVQLSAVRSGGCEGLAMVDIGAYEAEGDLVPFVISSADLNGDGFVDGADLGLLLAAWGSCGGGCCIADLDADGVIDGADFGILLADWS